jgi:hypothetical protein
MAMALLFDLYGDFAKVQSVSSGKRQGFRANRYDTRVLVMYSFSRMTTYPCRSSFRLVDCLGCRTIWISSLKTAGIESVLFALPVKCGGQNGFRYRSSCRGMALSDSSVVPIQFVGCDRGLLP